MPRPLSNRDFVREFIDFFEPERGLQLVGFCMLYRLAGYPRMGQLRQRGFFGLKKSAIYNAFTDLRRFRLHLVEQGYEQIGVTDEASNTYEQGIEQLRRLRPQPAVDLEMVNAVALRVLPAGQDPAAAGRVVAPA
jgi:hypothetical protein